MLSRQRIQWADLDVTDYAPGRTKYQLRWHIHKQQCRALSRKRWKCLSHRTQQQLSRDVIYAFGLSRMEDPWIQRGQSHSKKIESAYHNSVSFADSFVDTIVCYSAASVVKGLNFVQMPTALLNSVPWGPLMRLLCFLYYVSCPLSSWAWSLFLCVNTQLT